MGVFRALHRQGRAPDRGAVLVEFVLIFPVLMILIFGIIEVSRLGLAYHEAWTAAREGARAATTVGTDVNLASCAEITDAMVRRTSYVGLTYTAEFFLPGQTTAFADCDSSTAVPDPSSATVNPPVPGTEVIVTVDAPFQGFNMPFIGPVFSGIPLDSAQRRSIASGWEFSENGLVTGTTAP